MILCNGIRINPTFFPDGCQQVWKLPEKLFQSRVWDVEWYFETELEVVTMMQLEYLSDCRQINLTVPYLPYGRQDKSLSNDSTFGLRPFVRFIEHISPSSLTLFDPHPIDILGIILDHASYGLSEKTTVLSPDINFLAENYDIVCFPDAGAFGRYSTNKPSVYAEKIRNQATGKIESYNLITTADLTGKKVLVVDDICDGGATFLLLGEELKRCGAKADLYVSHGIFSSGRNLRQLFDFYGEIKTTNSKLMVADPQYPTSYGRISVMDWRVICK